MKTIKEIRSRRIAAGIPAIRLATKARINRSRLSELECGHVQPTAIEIQRLAIALEHLITAKAVIEEAAASVGWPIGGLG
jgi:transcriptional regulator with XRE-family HTH domain